MKAMETRSDELAQRAHATDWWTRCAIRDTLCARAVAYRHADPALATLLTGCAALIVAHNHPSGDPTPSPEDIATTRRLVEVGRLVGIELLDHIILGDGRFVSLKERGLIG